MSLSETVRRGLVALSAMLFLCVPPADAQKLVLVLGRETGSVELINAGRAVEIDGYSITSAAGRLKSDDWNSLTDQGIAGFREANPRNVQLSELALPPAKLALAMGDSLDLGNAYAGGFITPSEEDVAFDFTDAAGGAIAGTVKYAGASQVPTITVDRVTGNIELSNPGAFELDGYTIASASGLLRPAGLAGLASQGIGTWRQVAPSPQFISELNLEGTQAFDSNTKLSLGSAYDVAAGARPSGEDLTFSYSNVTGIHEGAVEFVGPINDLVLQVDSLTGELFIQNTSPNSEPFNITGYNIFSPSGSLSVEAWTSFADSGAAGAGWEKANPTSSDLSELNLSESTLFEMGTSISLGNILIGNEDLTFEYSTAEGAAFGTVQYVLHLDMRMGLPGDIDGDGMVGFPDFLILSTNFGSAGGAAQGDLDGDGNIGFPDFLVLSSNFGRSAALAVPEPCSAVLGSLAVLSLLAKRRRRRDPNTAPSESFIVRSI